MYIVDDVWQRYEGYVTEMRKWLANRNIYARGANGFWVLCHISGHRVSYPTQALTGLNQLRLELSNIIHTSPLNKIFSYPCNLSLQGWKMFTSALDQNQPCMSKKKAEHKEKDHVLAWQLAHDNLTWSHQHSKTGSRIDLRTQVLLLRPEYCPFIGCSPG
jgi:hypothetical protein